jgi:folate-binding protein YgfZ
MESQGKTTLKSMSTQWNLLTLEHLGVLRARGRDVVPFLQGQLSNDLAKLTHERSLLAGCHNPQGRVLALLRLLVGEPGEVLALLPRELVGPILGRLKGFVLRSRVELADESDAWRIEGLIGPGAGAAGPAPACAAQLPATAGAVAHLGSAQLVRIDDDPARWLILTPAAAPVSERPAALADCAGADPGLWRRLAVARGQPEVYAATSGEFVAQMLNLDLLGAIAFDKGCYTGQEVIARAHYRGRVKRRLQRFGSAAPLPLSPTGAPCGWWRWRRLRMAAANSSRWHPSAQPAASRRRRLHCASRPLHSPCPTSYPNDPRNSRRRLPVRRGPLPGRRPPAAHRLLPLHAVPPQHRSFHGGHRRAQP